MIALNESVLNGLLEVTNGIVVPDRLLDVLRSGSIRKIVAHGPHCSDGRMSAYILKHRLPNPEGKELEVCFVNYGNKEYLELPAEEGILFCDISPPLDRVDEFLAVESVVLDHHLGAEATVKRFAEIGLGVYGSETDNPGVSGAVLAALVVSKLKPPSPNLPSLGDVTIYALAMLVGIRDTWQTNHPRWVTACEVSASVGFWPVDVLLDCGSLELPGLMNVGPSLVQKQKESVQKLADNTYKFESAKGTKVAMFCDLRATSDASDLLKDCDVVVGFKFIDEEGSPKLIFSTRTRGSTFSCRRFCLSQGGGGHEKAAGFTLNYNPTEDENPYKILRARLDAYESV